MATTTAILVVLWERAPALGLLLVPPLVAIELYQRSSSRELRAMRLALTDPLTGLGNYRHFHERLQRELARAEEDGTRLTLCLVDVDDFKRVNDRFGHPAGDRVLSRVAGLLRQGGEAFRLGGDEFAVLLPGLDERAALTAAESIAGRIGSLEDDEVDNVLVSVGVASFPVQGAAGTSWSASPTVRSTGRRSTARTRSPLPARRRRPRAAEEARGRDLTAPPATGPPQAWRRRSTHATRTQAATPSGSASSRPGSRRGSGSTPSKSS